jgi:signal peptidase II
VYGLQERGAVATLTSNAESSTVRRGAPAGASLRLVGAVAVAAAVVAVDQLTKWWAVGRLDTGPIHVIWTLDLALSRNTGSAFSLFQGDAAVLVVIAVILVTVLLVLVYRSPSFSRAVILGLIIGGAVGNLSDRMFRGDHGAVVDFIDFHFWPTFNVADACIVVGCVLLAVSLFRRQPAT